MSDDPLARLQELMAGFDTAMLVTRALSGELRARPMQVAGYEDGVLFFTTRAEDRKLQEVLQSPQVAVTMQDANHYLSISGNARLDTDPLLAEKLWSPSMRTWFPEGFRDSDFTVICIELTHAEYWDRGGLNKLELLWESGKAIIGSGVPNDKGLKGHGEVEF